MNKDDLLNEINNVSSKLTKRIEQLGESLSQPEIKNTENSRKIEELLTQATAYGVAIVELVKAINSQKLKTIAEVNASVELVEAVKKFITITDRIFS